MEFQQLLIKVFERASQMLEKALDGLTQDDLNYLPDPDCNSIGWLAWHLTRGLDEIINSIAKEEQLWIKDGWHIKFNRSPDASDNGYGHSPEQVATFKCPDAETLLKYHRAVVQRSKDCLTMLSTPDLSREIDDTWSQLFPTVGARIVIALDEILQHAGQVCYIRGLRHGKGWQEF